VGCLSKLYKFQANLDYQDSLGATALHYAALGGHIDCVHFLVKHGAALHFKDREGRDPLLWTVLKGDIEMIKFLTAEGVNLSESTDNEKRNALHIASLIGNTSMCRFLIKSNMAINSKCNSGQTALVHAILGGRNEVVQILLENDADIDEKDYAGR
jgi:ankyrin repeat protein